jgi:plasmid stabilization system protein ParE
VSLPLDFHPAVSDETKAAYVWYQQQSPGLGNDFLDELRQVFSEIVANPARYGFADADIREGLLARFPYAVYDRVLPDCIRVLAVYHTSRHSSGWRMRG